MPFALGRPLGTASDPEFQKDVLRASLKMLDIATEPTIEDYPVEAPEEVEANEWVCPVSFPVAEHATHTEKLIAEVIRLAPWAAETRKDRGRTLFGATGATIEQVEDVARALGSIADTGEVSRSPDVGIDWQFEMPLLLRHIADDLRIYYHEAVAAQPGPGAPNHESLNQWIFGGTALGDTLQAIAVHLTNDGNPMSMLTRGLVIPEGYFNGGSAFPK